MVFVFLKEKQNQDCICDQTPDLGHHNREGVSLALSLETQDSVSW